MFTNFRKETSERSDSSNWAKQSLIQNTCYHFDSIEGCNENASNVATHLMERARVDYDGNECNMSLEEICQSILALETEAVLQRKINFAKAFRLNLTYVLYNDETQRVWMYEFEDLHLLKFRQKFDSFAAFSSWIATIKGWKSTKPFRENADLPLFDKVLRRAGTAWPTNIDCFISDEHNQPIAILEFQNAATTSVLEHCNNEFFLCKQTYFDSWGHIKYHDDIRRWLSQEILRVQSGLRLFIITWAQGQDDFILKEVSRVTFPELPFSRDWNMTNQYKRDMHDFVATKNKAIGRKIANTYQSYTLQYDHPIMNRELYNPPLSTKNQTFPLIYYMYKWKVIGKKDDLPQYLENLINM